VNESVELAATTTSRWRTNRRRPTGRRDVSDATTHPRILELPREETGLATSKPAVRRIQQLLPAFLEDCVADASADGLVVRLDGSVETAVAAALAVDAVGADRVTGLVMPVQLNDEAPARTPRPSRPYSTSTTGASRCNPRHRVPARRRDGRGAGRRPRRGRGTPASASG